MVAKRKSLDRMRCSHEVELFWTDDVEGSGVVEGADLEFSGDSGASIGLNVAAVKNALHEVIDERAKMNDSGLFIFLQVWRLEGGLATLIPPFLRWEPQAAPRSGLLTNAWMYWRRANGHRGSGRRG